MSSTHGSMRMLLLTSAMFLAAGTTPSLRFIGSAVAQERERTEGDSEARREMDKVVRESARSEARALALEISSGLRITSEEFFDFFRDEERKGKRTESYDAAWAKLMKGIHVPMRSDVTEADFQSADITRDTVGAFLRMKLSLAVDDLQISPEELALIETQWTLKERENYSRVLKRAAEIVDKRETATLQQAYERALREFAEKAVKCPQ